MRQWTASWRCYRARFAQCYYDLALLQNVPMRMITVDLDVKLSRDRPANRATKTTKNFVWGPRAGIICFEKNVVLSGFHDV